MEKNKTYEEECKDELYKIVDECEHLAQPIIDRMLKRAIKVLNSFGRDTLGLSEDYPKGFSAFDVLSIELDTKTYDEINPWGLEDLVKKTVLDEYEKLPAAERFFVEHSILFPNDDEQQIEQKVISAFHAKMNEQLKTRKIENFMEMKIW